MIVGRSTRRKNKDLTPGDGTSRDTTDTLCSPTTSELRRLLISRRFSREVQAKVEGLLGAVVLGAAVTREKNEGLTPEGTKGKNEGLTPGG